MSADIPFDAITTLLVFMVGVPAVLLQSLPPEVRLVVTKRWGALLVNAGIPVMLAALLALAGVVLHERVPDTNLLWSTVLAGLFVLSAFTAFRVPRRYGRRDAVVRRLEREVGASVTRNARLVEESLHDLIELGRQTDPGRGKEWVLQSLLSLSDAVTRHPRYAGDGLEDLVLGVVDIVTSEPRGSAQNFSTASHVLQCVVVPDASGARSLKQADLICAIRALSSLGRASLSLGNPAVSLSIVQCLGPTHATNAESTVSQALFEIGVEATAQRQTLIAMASLANLMTLVEAGNVTHGELTADTLGLIAHFWSAGETSREYARVRLERVAEVLESDFATALGAAARHCAMTTQFRTADLLQAMARDLERLTAQTQ
jgi:hypothetical protein